METRAHHVLMGAVVLALSIGLVAFGIQVGCIGLLGLYIAKIFREVQNRPLYVIRESYGQSADAPD